MNPKKSGEIEISELNRPLSGLTVFDHGWSKSRNIQGILSLYRVKKCSLDYT